MNGKEVNKLKKTRIEIDEQLVQALQKIVQRLDSIDGALNAPTPAFNEFNIGSTLNRDVQEAHHALQPEVAKENQIGQYGLPYAEITDPFGIVSEMFPTDTFYIKILNDTERIMKHTNRGDSMQYLVEF